MTNRREFIARTGVALLALMAGGAPLSAATAGGVYRVRSGDTLGDIAHRHGVSVAALKQANRLSSDRILVGQKLVIPSDIAYVVRSGDTLGSIAVRNGVTLTALKVRNNLSSDRILVGQKLYIPAGAIQPAAAPAHSSAVLAGVVAATSRLNIRRGRWTHVVVHHSGIEAGNAKAYDGAHRRRGMTNGLAYDFVIGNGRDSGDGEIEIGPRWHQQLDGGHVRSDYYNAHGIGICLVGNFEKRRPGATQLASLTALIDWLRDEAPLGTKPKFTVHRWVDKNHTVCPGRHFPYARFKARYA